MKCHHSLNHSTNLKMLQCSIFLRSSLFQQHYYIKTQKIKKKLVFMIFIVPPWVSFDTGKNVLKIANEPIWIIMSCDGTHSKNKTNTKNRTRTKGFNGFQQEERNTERSNLHGNDTICGWKLRAKNRFITTTAWQGERYTTWVVGKGSNVVFIHVLSTHIRRRVEAKFDF